MQIEIPIPKKYINPADRQKFVEDLIKWGEETLNDQDNWRYKSIWLNSIKFDIGDRRNIIFNIDDEGDGLAIKLTWCEE